MKIATLHSIICWLCGVVPLAAEPVVIVAPLSNTGKHADYEPLETGLQDLLIASLARSSAVAVVDRAKLTELLLEQSLNKTGFIEAATVSKVGQLLGASWIVLGSFSPVEDQLRVDCRVVDVGTSAVLAAEHVGGRPSELLATADQLGERLLRRLKLIQGKLPRLNPDGNPRASLRFAQGLGFYYAAQYDEAIGEFMAALERDPKNADARFWTARSYMAAKEWAHAKIEFDYFLAEAKAGPHYSHAKSLVAECERQLSSERNHLRKAGRGEPLPK